MYVFFYTSLYLNLLLDDFYGICGRRDAVPVFFSVYLGEFGAKIKNGCRVIDPQQQNNEGSSCAVCGGWSGELHVNRDEVAAQHK